MNRIVSSVLAAAALAGLTTGAAAQFVNGDFETGDFTGWTQRNTSNGVGAPGNIVMYAWPPNPASWAAEYRVGQDVFDPGIQEGIELVQELNLQDGVEYTISYDWSTFRDSGVQNAAGGRFHIIVDGQVIEEFDSGPIGGGAGREKFGNISGTFTATRTGPHEIGARITRPFLNPGDVFQYVDNFEIDPPTTPGLTIALSGSCPGQMTLRWTGAEPGRPAGVAIASGTGNFVIPGGPCVGTQLGLNSTASLLSPPGQFNTGPNGEGSFSGNAGRGACGRFLQMVVFQSGAPPCDTSNVVEIN